MWHVMSGTEDGNCFHWFYDSRDYCLHKHYAARTDSHKEICNKGLWGEAMRKGKGLGLRFEISVPELASKIQPDKYYKASIITMEPGQTQEVIKCNWIKFLP